MAYSSPPEQDELDACVRFLANKQITYSKEKQEEENAESNERDKQPKKEDVNKDKQQQREKEKRERADPQLAALTDLCLVIFNTNRFLYLE